MTGMSLLFLARKNAGKKLFRTMTIVLTVGVVGATLFSVTMVMESVRNSIQKGTARLGADLVVVPAGYEAQARAAIVAGEPSRFYMDSGFVERIRRVRGVAKVSPQIFLQSGTSACCTAFKIMLIAYDPSSDFTVAPWIRENIKGRVGDDEIIMGCDIARIPGMKMRFYGRIFTVRATLERTGMGFFDHAGFITMAAARKMMETSRRLSLTGRAQRLEVPIDKVSSVFVKVKPDIDPERVKIFIEHDLDGIRVIQSERVIVSVKSQLMVIIKGVLIVLLAIWVVAILLIGIVFSMIVNERRREIGLMRAMGATRSQVFRLIVTEASLLSLAGGVLGTMAGVAGIYSFNNLIQSSLRVPYLWPSAASLFLLAFLCLILAVMTGTGAALYPAVISSKMEPYQAIRVDE